MSGRLPWDGYFLSIAKVVATRSTCLRLPQGCGAVLVKDRRVLSMGYAGSIPGLPHCTDPGVGCLKGPDGGCLRTIHAEQNAVIQAAAHGVSIRGATLYTTLSPCLVCFKLMAGAHVERIVYAEEYRITEPQVTLAREARIAWEHYKET